MLRAACFSKNDFPMTQYKGITTLLGFLLIGAGLLSIILSMIGLQFSFLLWIDGLGRLPGFVLKIVMILAGFIIMYLAQTKGAEEEEA